MPMNAPARVRVVMFAAIAAGIAARLAFVAVDDGLFWPDEIYQSLEPAHRLVFGYGWQAWEFLDGARHWTLPGLAAGLFALFTAVGLSFPEQTLFATRAFFCLLSAAVPWAVYRLARSFHADPMDAALGAVAASLMGLTIYFAPRATGETASALPLILGLVWTLDANASHRTRLGGLVLLCAAVFLRLQNAIFCVSLLVIWLRTRPRQQLIEGLAVFVGAGVVYGLVDFATWGTFLHSFKAYVGFNLWEGESTFGREPLWFYVKALLYSEGPVLVPLAVLGAIGWRKAKALWVSWLAFFLVHSAVPHKELRFIYVLMPLLAALGAIGLSAVRERRPGWSLPIRLALVVMTLVSALQMRQLTFGRLGVRGRIQTISAIDYYGPENRLLMKAGHRDDVCGLRILSLQPWRTGGYTYLHKKIPMYGLEQRTGTESSYNFVIGRGVPPEGTVVARDGDAFLLSLGRTQCETDTAYDWHLE